MNFLRLLLELLINSIRYGAGCNEYWALSILRSSDFKNRKIILFHLKIEDLLCANEKVQCCCIHITIGSDIECAICIPNFVSKFNGILNDMMPIQLRIIMSLVISCINKIVIFCLFTKHLDFPIVLEICSLLSHFSFMMVCSVHCAYCTCKMWKMKTGMIVLAKPDMTQQIQRWSIQGLIRKSKISEEFIVNRFKPFLY